MCFSCIEKELRPLDYKLLIEPSAGNLLISQSAEAVHLYDEAIDPILGSQSGAARTRDEALELDGGFAFALLRREGSQDPDPNCYRTMTVDLD